MRPSKKLLDAILILTTPISHRIQSHEKTFKFPFHLPCDGLLVILVPRALIQPTGQYCLIVIHNSDRRESANTTLGENGFLKAEFPMKNWGLADFRPIRPHRNLWWVSSSSKTERPGFLLQVGQYVTSTDGNLNWHGNHFQRAITTEFAPVNSASRTWLSST